MVEMMKAHRATCSLTTSFPMTLHPWMTTSWMLVLGLGMPFRASGSCFLPWAMLCVRKLSLTATQPMLSLIFLHQEGYKLLPEAGKKTSVVVLCLYLCTLLCKVGRGLQVCVTRSEVVLDILQVADVLQFWHPCTQHLQNTTRQQFNSFYLLSERSCNHSNVF